MLNFLFNPRYPKLLLVIFLLFAAAWSIKPWYRAAWALETVPTIVLLIFLILKYPRFPLSNISYTLIFVFMCFHTIGSHYTYSQVPYNDWSRAVIGRDINSLFDWQRNHYDRLVHFLFGLLLSYPIREIVMRVVRAKGFWGYYLPLDVTMSFSMIYELIEWGVAVVFGGGAGTAYLGTQGDEWDAHKDVALATLGALITMSVVALINWRFDKRFGDELRRSLDGTGRPPLGERALAKLLENDRR